MFEIFSHRMLFNGIENNDESIPYFDKLNIGIELDLRLGKDGAYVSHDVTDNGILFQKICEKVSKTNLRMALHIKEFEVIEEVIKLLKKYSLTNFFMFNTEDYNLRKFIENENIASYVTKKPDDVKTELLWCDEIGENWYTKELITNLHKQNKILYGMSLELIKSCNENEVYREWTRLVNLGIDGICTKYPEKLQMFVKGDLN